MIGVEMYRRMILLVNEFWVSWYCEMESVLVLCICE